MKAKEKTIAVILSGSGVFDGSEIYETTLTLLAIRRAGLKYQCLAPNVLQHDVINHSNNQIMSEQRNVLQEAARLARGQILDLSYAKPEDYIAAILPGGFGAAKNLCTYGYTGCNFRVDNSLSNFITVMVSQLKPMGFICIAPVIAPKFYRAGVKLTVGNDPEVIKIIQELGGEHIICAVDDCVVDDNNKVVSTPAFMLAKDLLEIEPGINKLVDNVIKLS